MNAMRGAEARIRKRVPSAKADSVCLTSPSTNALG